MYKPRPGLVLHLFLSSSRVQRKRAILTVASIAWGTLALLLLLAFGEGLKISVATGQNGMGSNLAVIWPGTTSKIWQGLPAGRPIRPVIDDIDLLRERVPDLAGVTGEIHQNLTVTQGNVTTNAQVKGVSDGFGVLRNHIPATGGRFLNPLDQQLRRRVAFLGNDIAKKLYADEDPVGRKFLIDKVPYTVVGVMMPKVTLSNYNGMDKDQIAIPITTFKSQFGKDQLSNIILKPEEPEQMGFVLQMLNDVLGARYGYNPEDKRAMGTWDTVKSFQVTRNMLMGIQIFLGIIGALTLVIGGVGVANIMYAVVKERTKEIGIKMAMGARRGWITWPIVLEGLLYTLLGGAAGVLMAVAVVFIMDRLPTGDNQALDLLGKPTLSLPIGVASAAILGLIGITAGYFPARRAASINPAETLHYE